MAKYRKPKISFGVPDSSGQLPWLIVLTVLFFLAVCFSAAAYIKVTVVVLICLTLLCGALCFSTLRRRIRLPLVMLLLMVLMGGISTTYALSGKFALSEFLKLMSALCSGLLLLMLTPGEGAAPGRRIATVLEGTAALAALFSIDLVSTRLLSTPLLSLLGSGSADYQNLPGVESGVRITSIFTNPNIFAGCVGIGVLLSLGLVLSSTGRKERRVHLCCLYVSATAFVLAFSMGAIAAIAAAFLIYLLLEHKDRRDSLLILMVETLILVAVSVMLTSVTALDTWDGIQPVPLLCLIVGAVLLCLADRFVGIPLAEKIRGRGKLLLIVILLILVLLVGFVIAALSITGSITLEANETLRRAAYPAPGDYTLSAQADGEITVTVETQNRQDTMMHTSTVLYKGPLSDAAFTVPEDSMVVYFRFDAAQSATLDSVQYTGTESGTIALNYKLLPDFIANRLQGLRANQNAIQRVVFFEDGIKLFKDSPVIGFGLGAFENAIHRVQSFFYETKYVHNHYIQTLLETGIIGLIFFVGLLAASAAAILRARKKEDFHPLTPALGALLIFMAIHAATEVVFSAYPYLPMAFGVFMLINLCCANTLPMKWLTEKVKVVIVAVAAALMIVFLILLSNNMAARRITDKNLTFTALERSISLDKFEWADYELSYVMSSLNGDLPEEITAKAAQYAQDLEKVNSNTIPLHLAQYYFQTNQVEKAMEMAEKYADYLSASSEAWNDLFTLIANYEQPGDAYLNGIRRLVSLKEAWEAEHIGSIQLQQNVQDFLDRILS